MKKYKPFTVGGSKEHLDDIWQIKKRINSIEREYHLFAYAILFGSLFSLSANFLTDYIYLLKSPTQEFLIAFTIILTGLFISLLSNMLINFYKWIKIRKQNIDKIYNEELKNYEILKKIEENKRNGASQK